jgi:hypothetical protein
MAIGNELSSEVAVEMFCRNEVRSSTKELREIILKFHATLRALCLDIRKQRRSKASLASLRRIAASN